MDFEYFKGKVDAKLANDARKAEEKKRREEDEAELVWCELMGNLERVQSILDIGTYCLQNGISLDDKWAASKHGWGERGQISFIADGFYHRIGFDRESARHQYASALCIYAGGACGPWDFYVNGDGCFLKEEMDSTRNRGRTHPEIRTDKVQMLRRMKEFNERFPIFEKAFASYLESLS